MNDIVGFFIKLLSQITEGIGEVRIWGILPVYLLLYTLAGIIAVRFTGGAAVTKQIRDFREPPVRIFPLPVHAQFPENGAGRDRYIFDRPGFFRHKLQIRRTA